MAKKVSMIVRIADYDKVITPLGFAFMLAAEDVEVDIMFVSRAVAVLKEEGALKVRVTGDPKIDAEHEWLRQEIVKVGFPADLVEIFKGLKGTGNVHIYGCSTAAAIFGVTEQNMMPEIDGIVGGGWFLLEKAMKADLSLTF